MNPVGKNVLLKKTYTKINQSGLILSPELNETAKDELYNIKYEVISCGKLCGDEFGPGDIVYLDKFAQANGASVVKDIEGKSGDNIVIQEEIQGYDAIVAKD